MDFKLDNGYLLRIEENPEHSGLMLRAYGPRGRHLGWRCLPLESVHQLAFELRQLASKEGFYGGQPRAGVGVRSIHGGAIALVNISWHGELALSGPEAIAGLADALEQMIAAPGPSSLEQLLDEASPRSSASS